MIAGRVVARFVRASLEGWKSYMENPAPGNKLIKQDNTLMTDSQLDFGLKKLKELRVVTGGDAARDGIGTMSDERWKRTAAFMVEWGLLKPSTDWRKAYTLQFVKDAKVMP